MSLPLRLDELSSSLEKQCGKGMLVLRNQWHVDAAEIVAGFVLELEESGASRKVHPAEVDFIRFQDHLAQSLQVESPGRLRPASSGGLVSRKQLLEETVGSTVVNEYGPIAAPEDAAAHRMKGVFLGAAALMSRRIRDVVFSSLEEFRHFLSSYLKAPAEGKPNNEAQYTPALRVELAVDFGGTGKGPMHRVNREGLVNPGGRRQSNVNVDMAMAAEKSIIEVAASGVFTGDVKFIVSPTFETIEATLIEDIEGMVKSCASLPRVEHEIAQANGDDDDDLNPDDEEQVGVTGSMRLHSVPLEDERVEATRNLVRKVVHANRRSVESILDRYAEFEKYYSLEEKQRLQQFVSQPRSLNKYREEIAKLAEAHKKAQSLANNVEITRFALVNLHSFKRELCAQLHSLAGILMAQIKYDMLTKCRELNSRYEEILNTLAEVPQTSEDLVALQRFVDNLESELNAMKNTFYGNDGIRDKCLFLYGGGMPLNIDDNVDNGFGLRAGMIGSGWLALGAGDAIGAVVADDNPYVLNRSEAMVFQTTFSMPERVINAMDKAQSVVDGEKNSMVEKLEWRVKNYQEEVAIVKSGMVELASVGNLSENTITTLQKRIVEYKTKLEGFLTESEAINHHQKLLDQIVENYETEITNMQQQLEPYERLWQVAGEYTQLSNTWYDKPLLSNDAETADKEAENVKVTVLRLLKDLDEHATAPRKVATQIKEEVMHFLNTDLNLLTLLANPGIKERHWETMAETVGFEIPHSDSSTLNDMLALGLGNHVEQIEETCVNAQKEYSLEKAMERMESEWEPVVLELKPYKTTGTFILSGASAEEVQALLDDHIVKAQTMQASRYAKPILEQIKEWTAALTEIQNVLDVWLKVQATWLYLEPIFGSEDIMKQMPTEGKRFQTVDRNWRDLMKGAIGDPKATKALRQPGMLEKLQKSHELLDLIQKGLNAYLETKRLYFPRFFFLSNDELLEILAETKDPLRVQPHLKKCFEGIAALEFDDSMNILAMESSQKENVKLSPNEDGRPINPNDAKGNVEVWLLQVEDAMRRSVARCIDEAAVDYEKTERVKWVTSHPGQVVLCVSQTFWTRQVEEALTNEGSKGLDKVVDACNKQIEDIIVMVRGKLSKMERTTLGALVVLDVHSRDVTTFMRDTGVSRTSDFDWSAQLRYYWQAGGESAKTGKPGSMVMKMINARAEYANEYLGNTGRLVITPLTDRCYRTLMGAIHLDLGGAPEGPAGTGKTETVKDLAKAAGMMCVVFNCSDGLDYLAMAKFFKGLASSGAWACFDEFNRIELEVLSVVAQQILTIQRAKRTHMERFTFEGTEIGIRRTANVFITMNPGYAGRSELPDNLKALFRSVAMMVPDYALIAEIILYSFGYLAARGMARKIVATYRLCSEQLSSQYHYDYGMRAVMAVLRAAGNLKRAEGHLPEDVLVLRSIIDVNLPKFLSHDIPLFNGIVKVRLLCFFFLWCLLYSCAFNASSGSIPWCGAHSPGSN